MTVYELNIRTQKKHIIASHLTQGEALALKRNRIEANYALDRYDDIVVFIE